MYIFLFFSSSPLWLATACSLAKINIVRGEEDCRTDNFVFFCCCVTRAKNWIVIVSPNVKLPLFSTIMWKDKNFSDVSSPIFWLTTRFLLRVILSVLDFFLHFSTVTTQNGNQQLFTLLLLLLAIQCISVCKGGFHHHRHLLQVWKLCCSMVTSAVWQPCLPLHHLTISQYFLHHLLLLLCSKGYVFAWLIDNHCSLE